VKTRLPLLAILGSSLAFLASLFLNWTSAAPVEHKVGALGIIDLYDAFSWNGWASTFGEAAAVAAVALALCALVSIFRPAREALLPFGGCATAVAILTLVNAAELRAFNSTYQGLPVHLGPGAYVGGAAALTAFLSAAWVSHDEISERWTAAAATLLTIGLVAAFVLPAVNGHSFQGLPGLSWGTAVMFLTASFGLTFWFGEGAPRKRLAAAVVILVLVVGGFSVLGTHMHWPYEAWLATGCATGLVALAAASSRERPPAALGRADAVALTGATLLLASLFFNWQRSCGFGPTRRCYVENMWSGGLTGGLVGILLVLLVGFRHFSPELAVTIAIYVMGAGFGYTAYGSLAYGAFAGFAGAALLLVAVGLQLRKPVRAGIRLVPVFYCVAFLAIPVATLTGRLSTEMQISGEWRLILLKAAAIVVGLRLIGRWLSGRAADDELVVLPVALLALTSLDLGERQHFYFIGWEGWLGLALCVLLLVLGWIGQRGSLDNFRIPDEIWRIDRISAGEN
jgi:hypothetical protein